MGRPAVFLRLAGCPQPHCEACDTPRALQPGQFMSMDAVEAALPGRPSLVVITGGEPFAQWGAGLSDLAARLDAAGRSLQFETSGKAGIPADAPGLVVCSPKPMDHPRVDAAATARVDVFKFVICRGTAGEHTLAHIQAMGLPAGKVWLMPEGSTRAAQIKQMPRVWEMCVENGYRFSPRLHILTFDDRSGV